MAELNININNKVNGEKQVSNLKGAYDGLKASAEQASSGGEKATASFNRFKSVAKAVANETKMLGKGIGQNLSNSIKSIDLPFKNFAKSLMRIAKLRLLRGIIRSITGAFKEGLSNIYQYSAAMNNLDASHMKGSMDSLASSLLYMKNAVATAVAPLIASLIPVISQVANWFVTAASAVAQFFAALGGATTYTRAKKEAVEWGNVASGAGGAAAAAQEYKNTILGFDEIHALNDVPDGGGGGGGGGGATPDYSNMFEEAEVSQKIKDLVKWLKDNWQDILDIVEAVGLAMLAWKIASAVTDFFNKLGLTKLGGAIEVLAGLAITIIGVTLAFKGGYEIGSSDGVKLMDIVKSAVGVGLAGIGGAMVAKGITAMGFGSIGAGTGFIFGIAIGLAAVATGISIGVGTKIGYQGEATLSDAVKGAIGASLGGAAGAIIAIGVGAGGVIGFAVGVALSLFVTAISIEVGKQKASIERATEFLEEYDGQVQEIMDRQVLYITVAEDAWKNYDKTIGDLAYAKYLADQLDYLMSKESLSNEEMEKAQILMDELNGLGLDGINADWDENHEKIVMSKEAIYDNIEAMKEAAKQKAYIEILTAAWKDQIQAQIDMESSQRMVDDATTALNDKCAELGVTWEDVKDNGYMVNTMLGDEYNALQIANGALEESKKRHEDASKAVENAEGALDDYVATTNGAKDATDEYSDAVKDANDLNPKFNNTKKGMNNVKDSADDAKNSVKKLGDGVDTEDKKKPSFSLIRLGLEKLMGTADDTKGSFNGMGSEVDTVDKKNPSFSLLRLGLDKLMGTADDTSNSFKNTKGNVKALNDYNPAFSNIKSKVVGLGTDADTTKGKIKGIGDQTATTGSSKPSMKNLQDALWTAWYAARDSIKKVTELKDSVKNLDGMKATVHITAEGRIAGGGSLGFFANGGFVPGFANGGLIPSYASGGSNINSASLFMAHENGSPEMVGRIGNHTAVANTSQMVDAMAQGVYRAMSEVVGSNQGNVEVNVTLDGQRIARAVDNANRVRNRRFNVQA